MSKPRTLLRQNLISFFSEEELKTLCFDLDVEYGDLPAEGRSSKVRELIQYLQRRERLAELVAQCRELRPARDWPDIPQELESEPDESPPTRMWFMHNDNFVDRQVELEKLHQELIGTVRKGKHCVGLVGMGGIGKTQVAIEYAIQYRDAYPDGVFWIDASRPLEDELAAVSEAIPPEIIGQPQQTKVQAATVYLRNHSDVLLVLDNLADPAVLKRPLPSDLVLAALPCHILFTTRHRDVTDFQFIELSELPEQAALQLLLHPDHRRHILNRDDPQHMEAQKICAILGYLPLALEIASAHLRKSDKSLNEYCKELIKRGALPVLDDPRGRVKPENMPTQHKAAVQATLQGQWDALSSHNAQLLLRVAGQLPEAAIISISCLALFSGLSDKEEGFFEPPLRLALDELHEASFVKRLNRDQIRLHSLVYEFAKGLTLDSEQEHFRVELQNNAIRALATTDRRYKYAITAGECLLDPRWSLTEIRPTVLEALRQSMHDCPSAAERRNAALLLTRLDWLADTQGVSPDEMLSYLELIGRFVTSSQDCQYLLQESIAPMLVSQASDLSARQQAQLLVFWAAMLAQSSALHEAETDYREAQRIANELIGSKDCLPEDYKLCARINMGLATIMTIRAEKLEATDRQDMLHKAIDLHTAALESAQVYGEDILLEAIIYKELNYTHVLLLDWQKAEECYRNALRVIEQELGQTDDPEALIGIYSRALETASDTHLQKGRSLTSQTYPTLVLKEYETAYHFAWQQICILRKLSGKSGLGYLVYAHLNAGDSLWEMSKYPTCRRAQSRAKALAHWQIARKIAVSLGILEEAQTASQPFRQYCENTLP